MKSKISLNVDNLTCCNRVDGDLDIADANVDNTRNISLWKRFFCFFCYLCKCNISKEDV